MTRPGPGTPVTVVGLARSGQAATQWLLELGCAVRVTESGDSPELRAVAQSLRQKKASVELGEHSKEYVWGSELVVTSPGVPVNAAPLQWAQQMEIPVIGELELASMYCSGRLVAITGSNGKSSVVTLLGKILEASGLKTVVCGNIGQPFSGLLNQITPETIVVAEVSSFQLETSRSFHPEIACILNMSRNHLDRHGSMERYHRAKARILEHQTRDSWALLNADDAESARYVQKIRGKAIYFSRKKQVLGAYLDGGVLSLNLDGEAHPVVKSDQMLLQGSHHEENALAALALAGLLGAKLKSTAKTLKSFSGLPHRQERIATIGGITFINDSKSTTVVSGLKAIEAAPGRVVLIAGGRDKGSDFRQLKAQARKLKAAVLFGEDGPKIASRLNGSILLKQARDLPEAVALAFSLAEQGESVLLSPMCTSFDMFKSFEERGDRFTEAVRGLSG